MDPAISDILQRRRGQPRRVKRGVGALASRVDGHVVAKRVRELWVEPRVELDGQRVLDALVAHLAPLISQGRGLVDMGVEHEGQAVASVHQARAVLAHIEVLVFDFEAPSRLVCDLEREARLKALEHRQWLHVPDRGHFVGLRRCKPQTHSALLCWQRHERIAVADLRAVLGDATAGRMVLRLGGLQLHQLQQLGLYDD